MIIDYTSLIIDYASLIIDYVVQKWKVVKRVITNQILNLIDDYEALQKYN